MASAEMLSWARWKWLDMFADVMENKAIKYGWHLIIPFNASDSIRFNVCYINFS